MNELENGQTIEIIGFETVTVIEHASFPIADVNIKQEFEAKLASQNSRILSENSSSRRQLSTPSHIIGRNILIHIKDA